MRRITSTVVAAIACATSAFAVSDSSALSPDGRWLAAIVPIGRGDENGTGAEALVLINKQTGEQRRLVTARYSGDFTANLTGLSRPLFSLDGGYVYVSSSDASPNSVAVHQVDVRRRSIRFVIAGQALRIVRTGPYRGYLLVQQHRYYLPPRSGSYNPVFVVRPDGHYESWCRAAPTMMVSWPWNHGLPSADGAHGERPRHRAISQG